MDRQIYSYNQASTCNSGKKQKPTFRSAPAFWGAGPGL